MAADTERLITFWNQRKDSYSELFANALQQSSRDYYQQMPRPELLQRSTHIVNLWIDALVANNPEPLYAFSYALGTERLAEGAGPNEMMVVLDVFRVQLWELLGNLYAQGDWDIDLVHTVESWIHG